MPFQTIPPSPKLSAPVDYALLCFDAEARERNDDPDGHHGLLSTRLLEMAAQPEITNIFLFSHGWKGDVPAAIEQYNDWLTALMTSHADLARAAQVFPGFRPLLIGLHWPSLPWGNEEIGDGSYADDSAEVDDLRRLWQQRLGDTPEASVALDTIFDAAAVDSAPAQLSDPVRQAYLDLHAALGLDGPADTDGVPFDPDATVAPVIDDPDCPQPDYGPGCARLFSGMLGALRVLSYWTMKKRARTIGEQGMHSFVKALQAATADRRTRIHLMGHSFGTIVISSILGGPACSGALLRPIDSVFLAQGAVSLWAYAESIPFAPGGSGYFYPVLADRKVRGPLVTTRSRHDLAVGKQYPRATLPGEVAYSDDDSAEPPKYGAVGAFGFHGLPAAVATDPAAKMLPDDAEYNFEPGKVYNLDADDFICGGEPPSGAHNKIAGSEVAHAIWQAAFAAA